MKTQFPLDGNLSLGFIARNEKAQKIISENHQRLDEKEFGAISCRKKEEEEKKEEKRRRRKKKKKVGENNGQLRFVRHHVWRTQARLDQFNDFLYKGMACLPLQLSY